MRIGFFGGGWQILRTLERLVQEPDFEFAFVCPRAMDDPIIGNFARPRGVALMSVANINSSDAIEFVRAANIDVLLSINCKQIFKELILKTPRLAAINVHTGLLPRQRGGGGAYAAIVNHEDWGLTVHDIGVGIDDGDIIAQRSYPTESTTTLGDIQKRVSEEMPELVVDALRQIATGNAVRKPQSGLPYYYVPMKAPWDELIDWTLTSCEIFDRVRARTPGPANFYLLAGTINRVLAVEIDSDVAQFVNTVGQVLQHDPRRGVLVKTGDTAIWISRIRIDDSPEEIIPAYRIGTMLCENVHRELYDLKRRVFALEKRLNSTRHTDASGI